MAAEHRTSAFKAKTKKPLFALLNSLKPSAGASGKRVPFELFFNTDRLHPAFRCAHGGKAYRRQWGFPNPADDSDAPKLNLFKATLPLLRHIIIAALRSPRLHPSLVRVDLWLPHYFHA